MCEWQWRLLLIWSSEKNKLTGDTFNKGENKGTTSVSSLPPASPGNHIQYICSQTLDRYQEWFGEGPRVLESAALLTYLASVEKRISSSLGVVNMERDQVIQSFTGDLRQSIRSFSQRDSSYYRNSVLEPIRHAML